MRSNKAQSAADAMGLLLVDCVLRGDEIIADPAEVMSLAKVAERHGRYQAGRELTAIAARLRATQLFAEATPRRPK